jgi:pimeloyl-ACP methyl ester carboxylesterase
MYQRTSAIPDGEHRTPSVLETTTDLYEAAPLLPPRPGESDVQIDSFLTQPTAAADPTIHYTVVRPRQITHRQVVVLVHGAAHREDCYLARWAPSLATLGFIVIAVNLRGHGQITWMHPVSTARIAAYVADVRGVLDDAVSRGLLPASASRESVIAGHSLGSLVALAYAEQYGLAGAAVIGGPAIYLWMRTYTSVLRRILTPRRLPHILRFVLSPAAMFAAEPLMRELLLDHALSAYPASPAEPACPAEPPVRAATATSGLRVVPADPADVVACRAQLQPQETRAIVTDMRAYGKRGPRPLLTPHLLFLSGRYDVFIPLAVIAQSAASYRAIGVPAQEMLVDGAHDVMLDSRDGAADQAADALATFAPSCTTAVGV